MLNLQLAHKYSRAIFELAQEEGKLAQYGKELLQVKKDLEAVPAAVSFFANPQVERKAKKELVKKMYEGELSQSIYHFLLLLVDKRRFALLSVIAEQFREMANAAQGIVIADVTTAQPATEAQQKKIAAKLEAVTGKKVELRLHENAALLGGVVVKIGDRRIDGSVAGRLQALQKELLTSK